MTRVGPNDFEAMESFRNMYVAYRRAARGKRRLKKLQEEFAAGEKSLDDINRSIASYNGHLGHGDTYKLRKKVMGSYVLRCPHEGE